MTAKLPRRAMYAAVFHYKSSTTDSDHSSTTTHCSSSLAVTLIHHHLLLGRSNCHLTRSLLVLALPPLPAVQQSELLQMIDVEDLVVVLIIHIIHVSINVVDIHVRQQLVIYTLHWSTLRDHRHYLIILHCQSYHSISPPYGAYLHVLGECIQFLLANRMDMLYELLLHRTLFSLVKTLILLLLLLLFAL